jgi:hypothetical protein
VYIDRGIGIVCIRVVESTSTGESTRESRVFPRGPCLNLVERGSCGCGKSQIQLGDNCRGIIGWNVWSMDIHLS